MGGLADNLGVIPLIIAQGLSLVVGAYFSLKLPKPKFKKDPFKLNKIKNEMIEAFIEVKNSREILPVSLSMIMVGLCYMGNNLVTLPYITTERYGFGSTGFVYQVLSTRFGSTGFVYQVVSTRFHLPGFV